MKLYTSRITYKGPNRLDITVKSATSLGKIWAPTWEIVMGAKNGIISEQEYKEKYLQLMRTSLSLNKRAWMALLMKEELVICCYCKAGDFCHRLILAKEILPKLCERYGIPYQYMGEI